MQNIPDTPGRAQHIHAEAEVGAAAAAVGAARARPAPPEHLPAVRVRERQAVPRAAARRLRGARGQPHLPMMVLCDTLNGCYVDDGLV